MQNLVIHMFYSFVYFTLFFSEHVPFVVVLALFLLRLLFPSTPALLMLMHPCFFKWNKASAFSTVVTYHGAHDH